MKRTVSLILALALVFSAMLGIISGATEGGEESGTLAISHATLQFGSSVYLLIAVDYTDVYESYDEAKANITVSVSDKNGSVAKLTPDDSVKETDGFPDGSVGFKLTSLGAKNMADQLTIQAYNNTEPSGNSVTYSILEYAVKAKSESDSAAFKHALDAMLEFGAEAQRAFDYAGDYPLYDEDGYIDYGMLLVYGATTRKTFAPVETQVTPATNIANPILYTLSYDRIENNAITVKEGVQKAFYISADDKTIFHFDAKLITLPEGSNDVVYSNNGAAMSAAEVTAIALDTGVSCSLQMNKVAAGQKSEARFIDLDGERVLEIVGNKGYALTIGGSSETTKSLLGEISDSTSFTLTFTAAMRGTSTLATAFRLRSKTPDINPDVLNFGSGGTITNESADLIATLETNKLTTIHAVFDMEKKTISYYVDGTLVCQENWSADVEDVLTGTKGSRIHFFGGTVSRAGYLQKIIITKGNIFD